MTQTVGAPPGGDTFADVNLAGYRLMRPDNPKNDLFVREA